MQGTLVTFNGLLTGSKLFDIPVYQRSYAWEEDNLKDLWEDLYYLDSSKQHYFGTVILKDSGKTTQVGMLPSVRYDVIDGQQRLTTSLILLKEIFQQMKSVGDNGHKEQVEDMEKTFLKSGGIYKLNPQSGGDNSNIDDRQFFHKFIVDDKTDAGCHVETPSQQRLLNARTFFKARFEEERDRLDSDREYLSFLINFIGKVSALQIMQYTVDSDSDAIRMFETVNDRGRPLTNLEKTKSFLMHSVYLGAVNTTDTIDGDVDELHSRFANMYDFYGDIDKTQYTSPPDETAVQRYHFIYGRSFNSKEISDYLNTFKDGIRNELRRCPAKGRKSALKYACDLETAFRALKQIAETREKTGDDCLGTLIDRIYRVGRLGNLYPLLLASWLKFYNEPEGLARIQELIESFTFRVYVIGGKPGHTARTRLYRLAYRTYHGELNCTEVIAEMKKFHSWYISDETFEHYLRSKDFDDLNSYQIRYLLSEYEMELNAKTGLSWQRKMLESDYEVEHIWPSNTSKLNLSPQEAVEHQRDLHKLGNLTVVTKNDNIRLGNKPFSEKKGIFGDTSKGPRPRIQSGLTRFKNWGASAIKRREDRIVKFALERWKV